jgi:hypothetical protein
MTPSSNEIIIHPSTYTWLKNVEHGTTSLGGQLENRFTLRIEEEIIFKKNLINLIVGPTASGKTSLLMALLGQYAVFRAAQSNLILDSLRRNVCLSSRRPTELLFATGWWSRIRRARELGFKRYHSRKSILQK